jgi:integrase
MARKQANTRLQTREARRKLAPQLEPYWHEIRRGMAIGYYRGARGGVWWLREVRDGKRVKRRIAVADDELDADGKDVLSWDQAIKVAIGEERPTVVVLPPYTVKQAIEDYFEHRRAKSPSGSVATDQAKIDATIDAKMAGRDVNDLTAGELLRWRDGLVPGTTDRDRKRRGQATANRTWTILRATLNLAHTSGHARSRDAWGKVKPFANVDQPRVRSLSAVEAKRALNAMPVRFRRLARGALYTGLRLGELIELRAADVEGERVRVRNSKSGKGRTVPLSAEGMQFFDEQTAGLEGDAHVFTRPNGTPWQRIDASRHMAAASKAAALKPAATFHDLRRSYASLLINAGTDAEIIQELLGHADLRMTRRAYAHLLDKTIAKAVRKHLPSFGLEPSKVRKLRK